MRIVHVLGSFELGGAEIVSLSLASHQIAQGHEVVVVAVSSPSGPMVERFRAAGVPTRVVLKRGGFDVTLFPRLLGLFVSTRVDVVHTHNPQSLIYAAPMGRLAGRRVVHTKHGQARDLPHQMWLRQQAARCVDAFVSVSRPTDMQARNAGEGPSDRMSVIENGIDVSCFRPDPEARSAVRSELGFSPATRLIGTAGRLDGPKNYPLLLRAAAPLLGPEVALLFCGDGPDRQSLQALARSLGIEKEVRLLGRRSDMPRILAALDVFAMSSWTEGLPLALLEAMATALPVVCTAVGGIPDVVNAGDCGFLVSPNDTADLTASLGRLLGDPGLRRACGERGRALAISRYSVERMVASYGAVYGKSSDCLVATPAT